MPLIIERLARRHDRSEFDCGVDRLNLWLQRSAGQFDRRDLARTFVLYERGESRVFGYYALVSHRVRHADLPDEESRGLPSIDIPAILLGRLAVDRSRHGEGLGEVLLVNALKSFLDVAENVGVRVVEVDAIDASARRFYVRFGFDSLSDDPDHLFLPLGRIRGMHLPAV